MKLFILFGSQTGNAEECAYDLAREACRRLIPVVVSSLDEFDVSSLLVESLAMFIVSTTGQGEVPENMSRFWKALMNRNLPKALFEKLAFSVFGLGDSTYENFNVVGRKLFIRLKQLGGRQIIDKGLGDDIHDFSYEAEFHPWCEQLWVALRAFFPLLDQISPVEGLLNPMLIILDTLEEDCFEGKKLMVESVEVLSEKYTHTLGIQFENREFNAGDTLEILPPNSEEKVNMLMERMGWENKVIKVQNNEHRPFEREFGFPKAARLKEILTWYCDLSKPVSRYFIRLASFYATGLHKEKLREMSEKNLEGRNEYHRYVTKERRNAVEVLWDFGTIQDLPVNYFLEAVGKTRSREFSIASAPGKLSILASLVKYSTPLGRTISGHCTTYLSTLQPSNHVRAQVRPGRIGSLSPHHTIFIATGTGISPIWSLLSERCQKGIKDNLLFFGTRHPQHDFYFKREMEILVSQGLCQCFVAFSQLEGNRKHIQIVIREQADAVNEYLLKGANVVICGKYKKIVESVKKALVDCLVKVKEKEDCEKFVKNLADTRKIYAENW